MNKNWIKNAIKKPGQLHKDLNIPQGHTIPVSKIKKVSKGNSKTAQRARLALRLRAMHQ